MCGLVDEPARCTHCGGRVGHWNRIIAMSGRGPAEAVCAPMCTNDIGHHDTKVGIAENN